MRCHLLLIIVLLCTAFGGLSGCIEFDWKQQDSKQVRNQFHLPAGARIVSLESNPKTPGWFGREGLRISTTVQFSAEAFNQYLGGLNDKGLWKPTPFLNYSPSRADEYSEDALSWKELPLPDHIRRKHVPEVTDLQHGKYYCSVIVTAQVGRLKHNPAAFEWRNFGRACSELAESEWPTIGVFGVLNYEKKTLHAVIQFSG